MGATLRLPGNDPLVGSNNSTHVSLGLLQPKPAMRKQYRGAETGSQDFCTGSIKGRKHTMQRFFGHPGFPGPVIDRCANNGDADERNEPGESVAYPSPG